MSLDLPSGTSLSSIPLEKPPAGTESNFVDPPSLGGLFVGVCSAMMVLTLFFVSIRLFVALHKNHKLNLDDCIDLHPYDWNAADGTADCCITATVLSFAYVGLTFGVVRTFRAPWNLPISFIDGNFFKTMYAAGIILGPMMFLAKSSLLLLYLRIFGLEKAVRNTVYFTLAFIFGLYWVSIPITGYYCAPSPGNEWSIASVGKRCTKATIVGLVQGPLNVAVDLLIISLPVPVVLRLQLSWRNRVAVLVLFLTGILAVAASIVGCVYRVKEFIDPSTRDSAIVYACITIETEISIICSSMPMFASFYKSYVANHLFSRGDGVSSPSAIPKKNLLFPPARSKGPLFKYGDVQDLFTGSSSSLHTNIYTADHASMEEGIIMESLSVGQSTQKDDAADRV